MPGAVYSSCCYVIVERSLILIFLLQVVALIFKTPQPTLSGSMQNVLLRLMDRAKDICEQTTAYCAFTEI